MALQALTRNSKWCANVSMGSAKFGRQASMALEVGASVAPACDRCGARTRFVGLESHPTVTNADLCTYECGVCGSFRVGIVPRVGKRAAPAGAKVIDPPPL
jgi:hypothetical protein